MLPHPFRDSFSQNLFLNWRYILVAGAYLNPPFIAVCFPADNDGEKFILFKTGRGTVHRTLSAWNWLEPVSTVTFSSFWVIDVTGLFKNILLESSFELAKAFVSWSEPPRILR